MTADLLWVMNLVDGSVPTGRELNQRQERRFAPVSHELAIFTLDPEVWNNLPDNRKIGARSKLVDLRGHHLESVRKLIEGHSGSVLLGCLDKSDATRSIDGKLLAPDLLVTLGLDSKLFASFIELGYDVVDPGCLSGLANVGLNSDECTSVAPFKELTNDRGLFRKHSDAVSYSKVISGLAPEHAPFSPVRVLCNTL